MNESKALMQTKPELRKAFHALCEIEPRLKDLEATVNSYIKATRKRGGDYFPEERWYGLGKYRDDGIKMQLEELVGFNAKNKDLQSCTAYETSYRYLYGLLERRAVK